MLTENELLRLDGVGVSYQRERNIFRARERLWALNEVNMVLRKGETLGVIGRNGAGKSTLLRVLAGILEPDRGSIEAQDFQASLLSLQVGFVMELPGRDNVYLSGMLLGMSKAEIRQRFDEIVAFAEIEESIDQPIRTYSAGMRARLGFSIAYHVDPDVLLVDEVLGVGDASFAEKSRLAMKERISTNRTVVIVSHSESLIREVCDRALLLHRGRTLAEGDVDDVMKAYARNMSDVRRAALDLSSV